MRKSLGLMILIIVIINLLSGCAMNKGGQDIQAEKELALEEIQNEIIRFHVLANSDTKEDQELKIKVRDKVLEKMSNKFSNSNSIDDARMVILDSIDEINLIAKEVIKENGYDYAVTSELARENFPDKMYGDTLYPQGEYEAFRILIGEANGQNWWCVMFPPLCFVDESKKVVDSSKTEKKLGGLIDENKDDKSKTKIKFKFKLLEFFNKS